MRTVGGVIRAGLACAVIGLIAHGAGCSSKDNTSPLLPTAPPGTGGTGGSGGMVTSEGGSGGEGGEFDDGCAEDPCKLLSPQCGCRIGKRCVHNSMGKQCADVGGKPLGAECDNDCIAGLVCVDDGTGVPATCHRYCSAQTDCAGDGARCILPISSVDESLCTFDCDPILQGGCSATGSKCDVGLSDGAGYTHCTGAGLGVADETCAASSDCAAGLTCTSVNGGPNQCYTVCEVGNSNCPQGQCVGFGTELNIGNKEYGICV